MPLMATIFPQLAQIGFGALASGIGSRAQRGENRRRDREIRATLEPSAAEAAARGTMQLEGERAASGELDPRTSLFLQRQEALGQEDLARRAAYGESQLRDQIAQSGVGGAASEALLARGRVEAGRRRDALETESRGRELGLREDARVRGRATLAGLIDQIANERGARRATLSSIAPDESGARLEAGGGALVREGMTDFFGQYRRDLEDERYRRMQEEDAPGLETSRDEALGLSAPYEEALRRALERR